MKPNRKVVAIAIASAKVGYVVLRGNQLVDWKTSRKAARSSRDMQETIQSWLDQHRPDAIITEAVTSYSRKSKRTRALMAAAEATIAKAKVTHKAVHRERNFPNKYDEIEHLAVQYPIIAPWAPDRRKFYDPEPVNTIIFEALAMSEQLFRTDAPRNLPQ